MRDDERTATWICRLNFLVTGGRSLRGVMEVFCQPLRLLAAPSAEWHATAAGVSVFGVPKLSS